MRGKGEGEKGGGPVSAPPGLQTFRGVTSKDGKLKGTMGGKRGARQAPQAITN